MLFLLQVAEDKISLLSLLQKGGWIMYPLYFLLVIAIFVFQGKMLSKEKIPVEEIETKVDSILETEST
jgi:hypothetical protein